MQGQQYLDTGQRGVVAVPDGRVGEDLDAEAPVELPEPGAFPGLHLPGHILDSCDPRLHRHAAVVRQRRRRVVEADEPAEPPDGGLAGALRAEVRRDAVDGEPHLGAQRRRARRRARASPGSASLLPIIAPLLPPGHGSCPRRHASATAVVLSCLPSAGAGNWERTRLDWTRNQNRVTETFVPVNLSPQWKSVERWRYFVLFYRTKHVVM